jgi:5'-3' exonuclease
MEGDKADNLPGVPGVGLKTVAKRFPFLAEDKEYYLQDVYDECNKNLGKAKIYDTIVEHSAIIDLNYQMMQLSAPNLSAQAGREIQSRVKNPLEFNKTAVTASMIADGFGSFNLDEMFAMFKRFIIEDT